VTWRATSDHRCSLLLVKTLLHVLLLPTAISYASFGPISLPNPALTWLLGNAFWQYMPPAHARSAAHVDVDAPNNAA
jgi:hypothetical protein